VLNTEAEIRDIFGHLKKLIMINEEMGIEPPPIPTEVLNCPEGVITGNQDKKKGAGNCTSLKALRTFIGDCQRCKLHKGRNNLVFGEGSSDAKLVFVGEGPGREEDIIGKPLVGEAGKLLTKIIENGMGLTREDVYICNVVKCRPPGNRDPGSGAGLGRPDGLLADAEGHPAGDGQPAPAANNNGRKNAAGEPRQAGGARAAA